MLENTVGASAKLVRTETEYEGLLEVEELEEDVFRREEKGGGNVPCLRYEHPRDLG